MESLEDLALEEQQEEDLVCGRTQQQKAERQQTAQTLETGKPQELLRQQSEMAAAVAAEPIMATVETVAQDFAAAAEVEAAGVQMAALVRT